MRTPRDNYLLSITIVREFGMCPTCFEKGTCTRASSNSFHCTKCECVNIFEKDEMITTWYVMNHGTREIRSQRLPSSSPHWKYLIEESERLGKGIRRFRG